MSGKTCEICGKPSGMYPLCISCLREKEKGNIIKCDKCNKWHKIDEPCDCKKKGFFDKLISFFDDDEDENNEEQKEPIFENKCIICGEPSGKYIFCKSCYSRYKDCTVTLEVRKCTKFNIKEIVDERKKFKCKDGHMVRSIQEMTVDNYLYEHNIDHEYEKKLKTKNGIEIHPDFYLKKLDVYIEHYGFDKEGHKDQKERKNKEFNELGLTVIYTYYEDIEDPEKSLTEKLRTYKKGKINFDK